MNAYYYWHSSRFFAYHTAANKPFWNDYLDDSKHDSIYFGTKCGSELIKQTVMCYSKLGNTKHKYKLATRQAFVNYKHRWNPGKKLQTKYSKYRNTVRCTSFHNYLLCALFRAISNSGCVLESFVCGIILPVIKDQTGNASSFNYYSGIKLIEVIAKLLELVLLDICGLSTHDLQCGFKHNNGCSIAILANRLTVFF